MTLTLTIDGRQVEVEPGTMVLDAILRAGSVVPHLCRDPERPRLGTCRTCLVEIDGMPGTPASCAVPAVDGMVVHTTSERARSMRAGVLQLTVDMVPEGDPALLGELGVAAGQEGVVRGRWLPSPTAPARERLDDSNPFWVLDQGRCILCQRCIVGCQLVQQIGAIAMLGHGAGSEIGVFAHGEITSSNCTSCGQCWATCPTTAIRLKEPVSAMTRSDWARDGEGRRRKRRAD